MKKKSLDDFFENCVKKIIHMNELKKIAFYDISFLLYHAVKK